MTRRDECFLVGKRMGRLKPAAAARAWAFLAWEIEQMGAMDIPKYRNLITALRAATIAGVKKRHQNEPTH